MALSTGSSPLARGTLGACRYTSRIPRLIPARAGNTAIMLRARRWFSAHPRSRGEHCGSIVSIFRLLGSSPLARGTPPAWWSGMADTRLIPARAGNTALIASTVSFFSAHPRSRGEHSNGVGAGSSRCGSSPLARGTRNPPVGTRRRRRLIPARAGNTSAAQCQASASSAHPRSRGEHPDRLTEHSYVSGSSPLARGTRGIFFGLDVSKWLIPARAGNTVHQSM